MNTGDRVGAYTLGRLLGRGGMGVVWEARHEDGSQAVLKAIRVLDEQPKDSESLNHRLRREAAILEQLKHEHVVRFVESFEEQGEFYLVMEQVEGFSFDDGPGGADALSLPDRLKVLRQVAEALEYAHAHGVTHRDLKPANVMVSPGPRARVLDFGLARALDSSRLTATGLVMGTIAFMAPEQARGEAVDGRADIFSLGMMLARSLDLRGPFRNAAPSELYVHLVSQDPVSLDGWLPDDVATGLAGAVAKDPEERTQTASEALAFLDTLVREGDALTERIEQARNAPASERASAPALPPLARPAVDAAIDAMTARASVGKGGTLILLGHPGGGKSHALKQQRERLEASTAGVESYTFVPEGLNDLVPLQHLNRCGLLSMDPVAHDEATALLPDDDRGLDALVGPFLAAVKSAAQEAPCALLFDDIHHASASECAWLEQLAQIAQELPLLLVLAGDVAVEGARPERTTTYAEFLSRLELLSAGVRQQLELFDPELVRQALEHESIPEEVARTIVRHSGGNVGVTNHLLREWHRGLQPEPIARTAPVKLVSQLRSRWAMVDAPSRAIIRALVEAKGEMDMAYLQERSGLSRLVLKSRLRELERKHGWLRTEDGAVLLTQPFLATVVSRDAS